jgi:hypothetical protein
MQVCEQHARVHQQSTNRAVLEKCHIAFLNDPSEGISKRRRKLRTNSSFPPGRSPSARRSLTLADLDIEIRGRGWFLYLFDNQLLGQREYCKRRRSRADTDRVACCVCFNRMQIFVSERSMIQ